MDDVDLETLLEGCASEPIHAPGAVQPHGALLVLDQRLMVLAASANCGAVLGVDDEALLGRALADVLGPEWLVAAEDALGRGVVVIDTDVGRFECVAVQAGGRVLLEIEASPDEGLSDPWRLFDTFQQFHGATSVEDLADRAVRAVAGLTGFDRVVCYRFDDDWNGEVIAERRVEDVESFQGLRFPASDIPPQARAQYARTPLRLIPDSSAIPSPLVSTDRLLPAALDLSDATLRAVSPVHLHYLRNMGVHASMSVALTVAGQLWGIIACHHLAAPLRPSRRVRNSVELLAGTISALLAAMLVERRTAARLAALRRLDDLSSAMGRGDDKVAVDVLAGYPEQLLGLVGATGAVLVTEGRSLDIGLVPPAEVTGRLIELAGASDGPTTVEGLQAIDPSWAEHAEDAAGAILVPVNRAAGRWIVWYRREVTQEIRWAGDPGSKVVERTADGSDRLGPRASFTSYVEERKGHSDPWSPDDVDAATELAERLAESEVRKAAREAKVASQLQRTLLMEAFPEIDGVVGCAEYRPISNSPLGGDWYDVFHLPGGRSIIAVGDVAGHGFEVAGVMAQLRNALRAYLLRAPLHEALTRLNHLTRTLLPADLATVVLVELDPPQRAIRIANAGHLPPVIVDGSSSTTVEHRGPALGVNPNAHYTAAGFDLSSSARVALYSDGLVERRKRSLDDGIDALHTLMRRTASQPVSEQCSTLVDEMVAGTDVDDDVTLVVFGFVGM